MKATPNRENKSLAIEAIQELVFNSWAGDFEAIEAIRDIGLHAADALAHTLAFTAEYLRDHQAVSIVSEHSDRWPISIPAIEELRDHVIKNEIPPRLGESTLDARKRKGRGNTRHLDKVNRTRLAYDVYLTLESRRTRGDHLKTSAAWADAAAKLPMLERSTLAQWVDAGMALVLDEMENEVPFFFIVPPALLTAIEKRYKHKGGNIGSRVVKSRMDSARKYVVEDWLEKGLGILIGELGFP